MQHLTIGAVVSQTGTPASTIRYYEAIGLLPPPLRINGRRRYDALAVQRLLIIRFAQNAGFTLGEIRDLFFGFAVGTPTMTRWHALAQQKMIDIDAKIAQMHAMKQLLDEGIACNCTMLDPCSVLHSGQSPSPNG